MSPRLCRLWRFRTRTFQVCRSARPLACGWQRSIPELYDAKPEYIQSLADFVRSRPAQPVAAFLQNSNAVIAHDVASQLSRITAPTQITFGRHDMVTSARSADALTGPIRDSELLIFENCSHAPIYESVAEFNQKTLAFLQRHTS